MFESGVIIIMKGKTIKPNYKLFVCTELHFILDLWNVLWKCFSQNVCRPSCVCAWMSENDYETFIYHITFYMQMLGINLQVFEEKFYTFRRSKSRLFLLKYYMFAKYFSIHLNIILHKFERKSSYSFSSSCLTFKAKTNIKGKTLSTVIETVA